MAITANELHRIEVTSFGSTSREFIVQNNRIIRPLTSSPAGLPFPCGDPDGLLGRRIRKPLTDHQARRRVLAAVAWWPELREIVEGHYAQHPLPPDQVELPDNWPEVVQSVPSGAGRALIIERPLPGCR